MSINDISIIGNGFVGNAIYENFKTILKCRIYDVQPKKSFNTLEECLESDVIFVCLPTPMMHADGGKCNLKIIKNFFINLPNNLKSIFVIKSTVPIGTTKILQEIRKDLKIIHNPEFLTAANSVNDFKNAERNIYGGSYENCKIVADIIKIISPNAIDVFVSSDESEAIKYFSNSYLATKVIYFNLAYDLCNKLNLNYDNIIKGITLDSRIGPSHTLVPGPDGDRGFGGTCFPKDISALIEIYKQNNLNCDILLNIWSYNKQIRKKWDWANNNSAVFNGENYE